MSAIALRCKQVLGRDEADPWSFRRVAGVGDRVAPLLFEVRDARIFDAPLLVRRLARDGGAIPDLVDAVAVRRDREPKTRAPGVRLEYPNEQHDAVGRAVDRDARVECAAGPGERDVGGTNQGIAAKALESCDHAGLPDSQEA
jgi:hypothetical protein